jgi:hypothetical protein
MPGQVSEVFDNIPQGIGSIAVDGGHGLHPGPGGERAGGAGERPQRAGQRPP